MWTKKIRISESIWEGKSKIMLHCLITIKKGSSAILLWQNTAYQMVFANDFKNYKKELEDWKNF